MGIKRLLLVRHGLPDEGHTASPGDPPLHALGMAHAERLAQELSLHSVDKIVCSPQLRAQNTAQPLANLLNLDPEIHRGLAEIDYGTDRYRSAKTMQLEQPERWKEFLNSPAKYFGKDQVEYESGVLQTFNSILLNPKGSCIAVFSHGMTIKTLLFSILGVRNNPFSLVTLDHCSVCRVAGVSLNDLRIESINESFCTPPPI